MTVASGRRRAQIRGAMTEPEFLAAMKRDGFVLVPASIDEITLRFTHPEKPAESFPLGLGESYAHAYERLLMEIAL